MESDGAKPGVVRFFVDPDAWRRWLALHHETVTELCVGFYKKGTGKPSITWPEAVNVALCYGWIDGVRKRIDETSYRIRFTPRRPRSIWSHVNFRRAAALTDAGLMSPAGLNALGARVAARSGVYAYEQRGEASLSPAEGKRFRGDQAAWAFFHSLPPSYRRTAIWWVVSAKRAPTRERRLATLIADSAEKRRIARLARNPR
ncbi:MAG: YdeI/OmpD-associated family protein [Gemmatimonadaceae bacterium]